MKILILGGNSIANKHWVASVAKTIRLHGISAQPHTYKHWESKNEFIDIEYELAALQNSNALNGDYSIIAKSMGAVLALYGIHKGILLPKQCLVLGLPLNIIHDERLAVASWLADKSVSSTFIQNAYDPIGSYDAVNKFLVAAGVQQENIVMAAGDTHEYVDLEQILTFFVSTPTK